MQKAREECGAGTFDQGAYKACMAKKGWTLSNWSEIDPLAAVSVTPDNRGSLAAAGAVGAEPARAPASAATPPALPPAPPAGPKDMFRVGSWWKAGGSETGLNADVESCVARLGEDHRPDKPPRNVTRALLTCLRDQGWHGVRSGIPN